MNRIKTKLRNRLNVKNLRSLMMIRSNGSLIDAYNPNDDIILWKKKKKRYFL